MSWIAKQKPSELGGDIERCDVWKGKGAGNVVGIREEWNV